MIEKNQPVYAKILKRLAAIIAWVFILPFSMIPLGIVVVIILGVSTSIVLHGRAVNGVETRTYIFVFGVIMALLCAGIIYLLGRSKREFLHTGRGVLIAYTWVGIVVCGLLSAQIPDTDQTTNADT